ncbi:RagB/SusD family nutrient uptake outer membrane protein [Sphingobacterium sp. SRCM116780]|uniref:RagB/SusD family nutrient uptake outer membrane protein n=1 Tax=Sphingobacterium sp. SRCM116780 TaxID=2907623 RepID=UPI001F3D2673|nr:RagB/SusD family nutrient uptake outer membrane protein [Sphingobacterium sp. SRCM116780]UIR56203.1 RagB/SusD family nutrient uptake outer membrane protein [Sphingobacterium sp. SRCM116780]
MKKNRLFLLLLAGLALTTSCNKFLEEEPKSTVALSAFYKTEAQAEATVNSLYRRGAPQRYSNAGSAYTGPTASFNTMLTGYFTNSYEGQERVCLFSRELTRQNNTNLISGNMNTIWDESFQAINIANAGLKYIPEISMSDADRNILLAEAKFFRAYNYFYLVKTFGAIPLSTTAYESLEDDLYLERSEASKVYALIETDLKEAVNALPAIKFASNGHRITKFVAAMTLANVYLQQGKYAEAAETAKIVVNSPHSMTVNTDLTTNSAFNKLRKTDDLDEVIYAQEYDGTISNSGWWPTYAFNSSAVSMFDKYSIFERVFGPTKQFLNVYNPKDLRIQPNQFFHWSYTNPKTGKKWESTDAGVWYYYDEEAVLTTGKGTKDWNFYRYPEALLIAAEGIAKSGGVTAEAAGYLAQVKARANTEGKTVAQFTTELQGLSADNFVKECWIERLREFPLEFKMWDDIARTKMFPVISTTEAGKIDFVPLIGAKNASGAVFKESDLLWPISPDEIQRNPKLTQNEGYK